MIEGSSTYSGAAAAGRPAAGRRIDAYWLVGLALTAASVFLFFVNTRHGIGILPDSTRYMGISEVPYDAPVYHWMLQGPAATGMGLSQGAKLIALFFLCANCLLLWHILARTTGRYGAAALGSALILFAPAFVAFHAVAMSEAPFLFCLLLAIETLRQFWIGRQRGWVFACGLAIGVGALVRFTAPPMGAAIALALLCDRRVPLRRRFGDALILAAVSAFLFLGWSVASELVVGRSTGRALAFYGNMKTADLWASLNTFTIWLFPSLVPMAIRLVVTCAALAGATYLFVRHVRNMMRDEAPSASGLLTLALGFFFPIYLCFMVLAISLEANLTFNSRYGLPIYMTGIMMLTILLARIPRRDRTLRTARIAFLILGLLVLGSNLVRSADRSRAAYRDGIGYAGVSFTRSPLMEDVARLPENATLYSNGQDAIAYVLGRPTHLSPSDVLYRTGLPDPANPLSQQIARINREAAAGPVYIIFVDGVDWRFYLVPEERLQRLLTLKPVAREKDGRIYAVVSPSAPSPIR